jgi:hypothetical protein
MFAHLIQGAFQLSRARAAASYERELMMSAVTTATGFFKDIVQKLAG